VIIVTKINSSLFDRIEDGIFNTNIKYDCGKNKDQLSIPLCARKLSKCMKSKCNEIVQGGLNPLLQIESQMVPPLPLSNRTVLDETHWHTEGYDANGFRLSLCEDANIAFLHIFKSAGTYAVLIFKKFCLDVTGKDTVLVQNEFQDPNWKVWTTLRDPEHRFISAMFEISRRSGEKTDGGISAIISSLNDDSSANEEIVSEFIDIYTQDYSKYDFHLHPQLDFIVGVDDRIYDNLDYAIHLDDGDLLTRIMVLLHHMFKESYPGYEGTLEYSDYALVANNRDHKSISYGVEDDNFGEDFFKNIKIEQLEDELRDRVKALYKWDYDCFDTCGY